MSPAIQLFSRDVPSILLKGTETRLDPDDYYSEARMCQVRI